MTVLMFHRKGRAFKNKNQNQDVSNKQKCIISWNQDYEVDFIEIPRKKELLLKNPPPRFCSFLAGIGDTKDLH